MGAKIIHIAHEQGQPRISITSSTMYRAKLTKSSPKQRRALLQLEQKFERSLNAGTLNSKFQPDSLIRRFKEVTYKGVNGTIHAFFRDEKTVVFLDFSLARGNGGGTPKIKIQHIIAAQSLNRARAFVEIQRTQFAVPLRIASFVYINALFFIHALLLGTARVENSLRRYAAERLYLKPGLWLNSAPEPVAASPADTDRKPKQLLFGEIVNALSALLEIEYGGSRRSSSILPRVSFRSTLTRQLTRQMLFGEMVHALSVYFGSAEEKTVRRSSPLALGPRRRVYENARSANQYAGRILFGELVATLSIYLSTEDIAAPPPSWSVLSQIGEGAQLSHQRARRILFGEMVGTLALHLDIPATAAPPSWSILSRVGQGAPLSHQHTRRILFSEIIGILAAYLDVARVAVPPSPVWSELSQSDERILLTGDHCAQVVFGEVISALSAYSGTNSSAAPPSTWLTVSEVGERIPLTGRLKERVLFSEIIAALAACLNTERTGRSRLWATWPEIDKRAALTVEHARRMLFGKIVSALAAYLDPKYDNQGE